MAKETYVKIQKGDKTFALSPFNLTI